MVESLLQRGDPFLVLADFDDYVIAQDRVDAAWRDQEAWTRMSILNSARMGRFSSDRTVWECTMDIWRVEPVPTRIGRDRRRRVAGASRIGPTSRPFDGPLPM